MPNFIYGFHAIEEILKHAAPKGKLLVAKQNKRAEQLVAAAKKKGLRIFFVADGELDRYCENKKHKGLLWLPESRPVAAAGDFKTALAELSATHPLVILLDSITDPHNYGAILRSADQFYADLVITTEKRAARETETVASTSAGANLYVKKQVVTNLVHVMDHLKEIGYWIYGADIQGSSVTATDLTGKTALVLGSEGKGLRPLIREKCDVLIKIPSRGHVDSLNVSVAAGILMYEIRRQQEFA